MSPRLSLALLGLLSFLASLQTGANGDYGSPLNNQDCPTKDFGVCCYILESCEGSGQDDASCNSMVSAATAGLTVNGGSNNGNVPQVRSGCYDGQCLLALDSDVYPCSLFRSDEACAACEPVFGPTTRGVECSIQVGAIDNCCYVQDAGTNPNGFQGCTTTDDCDPSLYPDTDTFVCRARTCFYISNDPTCSAAFNQCNLLPNAPGNEALLTELQETCNALASAGPGTPIPDFFPASAPGPVVSPGAAVAPASGATPSSTPTASPSPTVAPTSNPSASPTVTAPASPAPTSTPGGVSQPSTVPVATTSAPTSSPSNGGGATTATTATPTATPTPTPSPPPSGGGGTSCIAVHQTASVRGLGARPIAKLTPGDMVLTAEGYQPYLGSMHDVDDAATLVLTLANGRSVELSHDHLIKTEAGFVHAAAVAVGTVVASVDEHGSESLQPVVNIAAGSAEVAAPLTRSGTIVVNGVVLSCHAAVRSHTVANVALVPVRLGLVTDMQSYVRALVWLYDRLPGFMKAHLVADGRAALLGVATS